MFQLKPISPLTVFRLLVHQSFTAMSEIGVLLVKHLEKIKAHRPAKGGAD
jgi:hypothetical protein